MTSAPALLAFLQAPQMGGTGTNAPVWVGNSFRCGLSTQPGVTYAVEYQSTWESNWQMLRIVAGDGNTVSIMDSGASTPCRYYRARVL